MDEIVVPSLTREPIPAWKYKRGFIAIKDREIIDHDLSFPRLAERMRRRGLFDLVTFMGIPQPELTERRDTR